MIVRLLIKAALTLIIMLVSSGDGVALCDFGGYTPPAEITYVETSARQEGNELIFGNLFMELPEGVAVEVKASADTKSGQIIRLNGAQGLVGDADSYRGKGPFPPQISLAHYMVEYERRESLISALLDLAVGTQLSCQYADGQNREYIFYMKSGDGYVNNYYALVNDNEVYLVMEYYWEEDYSFSALMAQERVKWQDSGKSICGSENSDEQYFKITPEKDIVFLCHHFNGSLNFYIDGYYDSDSYISYDINYHHFYNDSEDINFDGYKDVEISNTDYILIWNPDEKNFVKFKYPEDMRYSDNCESFPETKTIWYYDYKFLMDEKDWVYIESLWGWDDFTLVKRRECRAEIKENEVRILAYEGDSENVMFDESFTLEEWEYNSNERIRELYELFYDGFVPKEFRSLKARSGKDKIPQGLLDKITNSMVNGTELETLNAMRISTELTMEEVYALAQDNEDIRMEVLQCYQYAHAVMVMAAADVDNDGIEDIIAELHGGGSGGYVYFVLFKGQEDGSYIETSSYNAIDEEFGIIVYKGKNYLARTLYDYGKKIYNGFCIAVYDDGTYTEEAELILYAADYNLTLDCGIKKYKDYANGIMEKALSYENSGFITGDAEELAKDSNDYEYMCDLDNDGELEYYNKGVWETTNIYTVDCLYFENEEDAGVDLIHKAISERHNREDYYNQIMLWADKVDNETVVNIMYQTGLEDFVIAGYVISGAECNEVYEVSAEAVMGVKQTFYDRGYYDRGSYH